MPLLLAVLTTALPIPHNALLAIDHAAGYRNYLPTHVVGFTYSGWSKQGGVLRVALRTKAGPRPAGGVLPMSGNCDTGKQKSFQLGGNKVFWAQNATEQRAWRCVFDQAGKPSRLEAATTTPPTRFAAAGLGIVAAHARRY